MAGDSQRYSPEGPKDGFRWYFSRKEIEENSPSKLDGVDLKKEAYLRKSYCSFLQDLGMRLKVPQVTIASAIIFCHRFFLRQSHAKNDRKIIATVCMFLAGKVEETPRPLKDVIIVSYEIIHKKDPAAVQRIKQKEVYELQKELVLLAERVVLATLGFDFNMQHPYKPLVEAIKKFKVAQHALAQVAWNFVNDGLRTSLCLQFNPHHIAAGAIFLAAKFLKVKLPSDGDKVWWQEFDVTPRQLEEVSNQMLELYEQNRTAPSNNTVEGPAGGGNQGTAKPPTINDQTATANSNLHTRASSTRHETSKPTISKNVIDPSANHVSARGHGKHGDYGTTEMTDMAEVDAKCNKHPDQKLAPYKENFPEAQETGGSQSGSEKDLETNGQRSDLNHRDAAFARPPQEVIKKIDRYKVKAALEKRKQAAIAANHITKKTELMDEDDLIERAIEDGVELASQNKKNQLDKFESLSMPLNKSDYENMQHGKQQDHADDDLQGLKGMPPCETDRTAEEGELFTLNDINLGVQLPKSSNKRKARTSPDRVKEGKKLHGYSAEPPHHSRFDYIENRNKLYQPGHSERDSNWRVQ
ncbi:unnamed protein product [Lathyrus sativus]|nr:unnamed protein product [Lathyrus sativus]